MTIEVWVLLVSLLILVVYSILLKVEQKRQKRVFLTKVRTWLDKAFQTISNLLQKLITTLWNKVFRLTWYYAALSFFKSLTHILEKVYLFVYSRARKNHLNIKKIKSFNSETKLGQVLEHKESTILTDKEKSKMKQAALEK